MSLKIEPVINFDTNKNALCVVEDYKIKNIRDAVKRYASESQLELTIIHSIVNFQDVELIREYKRLSKDLKNVFYHEIKASPHQFCLAEQHNPKLSLDLLDIFREPNQELYVAGSQGFKKAMRRYSH